MKKRNFTNYIIEFVFIFIAVASAFALDRFNEDRKSDNATEKILKEIKNGFKKDIEDLRINMNSHKQAIESCQFWRSIIKGESVVQDSLLQYKYLLLTRDYTSLQNTSGYEALKSRGLELIDNDSLRADLISLYEYDYYNLKKLEEDYEEMQFHKNYFKEINQILSPHFVYDEKGDIINIETPLTLNKIEKNILMSYLLKIEFNRRFTLKFYQKVENKIQDLEQRITKELEF